MLKYNNDPDWFCEEFYTLPSGIRRKLTVMTMRTFNQIPQPLISAVEQAESVLASVQEVAVVRANIDVLRECLGPVFACSPFIAGLCQRSPALIVELLDEGLLNPSPGESVSLIGYKERLLLLAPAEKDGQMAEDELMRILRVFRNKEMVRIGIRDLLQLNSVVETLEILTNLAEACVDVAQRYSREQLISRFGLPVDEQGEIQQIVVLAMGKLGGRELNYSSDIDLILVFRHSGQTNGKRSVENAVFFRRQAQSILRILGQVTQEGFVFRTDLRLRPFGESGPLVMNFNGVENYYLTQGREWERYAMIKARTISGNPADCEELSALLKPFVFRRYLDYNAFESLRDLKQRIAAQVKQKSMHSNVKLGPGGIREVEFIGQAFQLVRGGRETELQDRSILRVLEVLQKKDLLTGDDYEALTAGYLFLRRVENYLQMMHDAQTHDIPTDQLSACRLQFALGKESWEDLLEILSMHRQRIETVFEAIFRLDEDAESTENSESRDCWLAVLQGVPAVDWLISRHFDQPELLSTNLAEMAGSKWYSRLTTRGQQRVDAVIPLILSVVGKEDGSAQSVLGLLKLVRSVAGRSVYLQVLLDTVPALELLARLFSRSTWLAEFVCQHPIVIDELLDYRNIDNPPDRESLETEMGFVLDRVRDEELDVQMDALRQYRLANTMRIAAAELEGRIDLMCVSDRLSWLAEIVLQAVADLAWAELTRKFGVPVCWVDGKRMEPTFAIVAYGKLGGLELGYGSDLDIVFLHDSEGEKQSTDSEKSIENQVFFARLAQKLVNFISTLTPAGILYETDTRLRPNGQSGMLVSGLTAFEQYQLNEAWTWEHQALVRARVVVGKPAIVVRFNKIRVDVLSRSRPVEQLRKDVVDMRERMRKQLGAQSAEEFDLKQDFGGIADIEFMVQYMVLSHASAQPELASETDNVRILERTEKLGLLPAIDVAKLQAGYLAMRDLVHKLVLQEQSSRLKLGPEMIRHRDEVRRIWQEIMIDA